MKSKLHLLAILLACVNIAISVLVLYSPYGIGEGSGVIGYSIVRLLVLVIVQAPVAFFGIVLSCVSWKRGFRWAAGLIGNIVVIMLALFLYSGQYLIVNKFA